MRRWGTGLVAGLVLVACGVVAGSVAEEWRPLGLYSLLVGAGLGVLLPFLLGEPGRFEWERAEAGTAVRPNPPGESFAANAVLLALGLLALWGQSYQRYLTAHAARFASQSPLLQETERAFVELEQRGNLTDEERQLLAQYRAAQDEAAVRKRLTLSPRGFLTNRLAPLGVPALRVWPFPALLWAAEFALAVAAALYTSGSFRPPRTVEPHAAGRVDNI